MFYLLYIRLSVIYIFIFIASSY
uniref:Uncharacterized protein n=1 Tax=Heterorhabditis bacteriophora TaxID=37862 RepID=A0A1I7W8G7_HETBA